MEREAFLSRIPSARTAVEIPDTLPPTMVSGMPDTEAFGRFAHELRLLGGEARRVPSMELDAAIAAALADCASAVVGPDLGVHEAAVAHGLELAGCRAEAPGRARTAAADAGVTGALLGVSSTGSVLVSSVAGSRLTSLLPPLHVVVLEEDRLVPGFEELFEAVPRFASAASQLVLISGPSRTSDIEMTLVHGVHGPRRLIVLGVQS